MIKVVDLFAGPGGLGEGFSALEIGRARKRAFDVVLSIEKDATAFQTLHLRAFYREFQTAPAEYYEFLRGTRTITELYQSYPREFLAAQSKVWNVTLGPGGVSAVAVRKRVESLVSDDAPWVLIGGPPCQAYSLIGRARNRGVENYDPESDVRQRLYVEYLQILADHAPPVFIMENVKGLLSASLTDVSLFQRILSDLRAPAIALRREQRKSRRSPLEYRIYSLTSGEELTSDSLRTCVVRAEDHGIPQSRHRVILLGVRSDLQYRGGYALDRHQTIHADAVLHGLPELRSGLSKADDTGSDWLYTLRSQLNSRWANAGARSSGGVEVADAIQTALRRIRIPKFDRGGEFVAGDVSTNYAPEWFSDRRISGITNHSSRSHIAKDLFRYLYATCFASVHKCSPTLKEFPKDLLPNHVSAAAAIAGGGNFSDRFRVQVSGRPSTTIVSHISKDGHYYIHPDASQCRSLTVREAARLQTFADNYHFCGPRTSQFVQVGNAVPPLLARQIASIVYRIVNQN